MNVLSRWRYSLCLFMGYMKFRALHERRNASTPNAMGLDVYLPSGLVDATDSIYTFFNGLFGFCL